MPVLAGLGAAAVQGLVALGPRAGTRAPRQGNAPEETDPLTPGPCHAQLRGFDLHAGIGTRAGQRDRLERLCRYAPRPPMAQDRLRLDRDGRVWLALRRRWSDGTTHLTFDPVDLLGRLAVLIPRPRVNLVLYYGVLAPRAPWRTAVVGLDRILRRLGLPTAVPEPRPARAPPAAVESADIPWDDAPTA